MKQTKLSGLIHLFSSWFCWASFLNLGFGWSHECAVRSWVGWGVGWPGMALSVKRLSTEVSGGWTTCIASNRLVWASSYGAGILGTETASPFQASACITFVNVLLVWVSHMAHPKERGREKINSTCKNTCKVLLPFLQFTTVIKLVPVKHLDERKWMLSYYSRCIFLSNIISPRWICYVKKQNKYTTAKRYPVGGRRNSPLLAGRGDMEDVETEGWPQAGWVPTKLLVKIKRGRGSKMTMRG